MLVSFTGKYRKPSIVLFYYVFLCERHERDMIYHRKFIAVLLGMPFSELNINHKRVAIDTSYEKFQAF